MLLLGIDTTTLSCSVAVGNNEKLYGEFTLNIKKTHSQRLMPLIVQLLQGTGFKSSDLEGIIVSNGPGSFTGTRIGVATARGLSQGLGIPVVGINSLEVLAAPFSSRDGLICPLLDARRQQVYTALYRGGYGEIKELLPPRAMRLDDLMDKLLAYRENVLFTGEGFFSYSWHLHEKMGDFFCKADPQLSLNRGAFVLKAGFQAFTKSKAGNYHQLIPFYLRLPEAERRLQEQNNKGSG